MEPNPNSVLSAIVLVSSHGANTLRVRYEIGTGPIRLTPEVIAGTGSQIMPVLGLQAATTYAMQVVASDGQGGSAYSQVVSFTTGTLPTTVVQHFTVSQSGPYPQGYIVLPKLAGGTFQRNPYPAFIVDRDGNVVWYQQEASSVGGDFKKESDGSYTIDRNNPQRFVQVDVLGNPLATYQVTDGGTDQHEFSILPDGDRLMIGTIAQTMDMTSYGGLASASVVENTLWRIHADGGVAFYWNAFDHTTLDDVDPSITKTGTSVDATHCNAFGVAPDGNYILSIRHMSQVLKIDAQTGEVIWRLGRNGEFAFINDPLDGFSMQHHSQEIAPGDVLLFDDGNEHQPTQSRAAEYQLDTTAETATLIWSYEPLPTIYANAMGSAQRLSNGDTLIAFGTRSRIDEVDAQGNLVWQLVDDNPGFGFYRAFFIDSLY